MKTSLKGNDYTKKRVLVAGWGIFTIGILFYILNKETPLFADDYAYLYSFYNEKRILNLSDIVSSLRAHYFIQNGRIILHFLSHSFLLIGKDYFNIINTIAFIFLGLLIFYHGIESKLIGNISLLIFIYCSLFVFTPAFGQSFLWVTGSSNYLYGIELVLIYLIPFRYLTKMRKESTKKYTCVLLHVLSIIFKFFGMLILGFVAGATNENVSIALIAVVFVFMAYYKIYKIKIKSWMISGWIGNILGCISILMAPGELKRLENSGGGVSIIEILKNIMRITWNFADYFAILILLFAMLVFLRAYNAKMFVGISKKYIESEFKVFLITLIYGLGFLGATYSMIVVPGFPDRTWSGPLVFLLITLLSFYERVSRVPDNSFLIKLRLAFITCFSAVCILVYAKSISHISYINRQNTARINLIESFSGTNQTVYAPAIKSDSRYSCFGPGGDLQWDSDGWPNAAFARHYGVSRICRDDSIILEEIK